MSADSHNVLLIVKDPKVATFLSQNMRAVDVLAFGAATMGMRYDVVVVCDATDGESIDQTAMIRRWLDTSVKTRVVKGGTYVESYRRETPADPADPPI